MLIIKCCAVTPLMAFPMSFWRSKVLHISFSWSMSSLNEVVVDLWLLGNTYPFFSFFCALYLKIQPTRFSRLGLYLNQDLIMLSSQVLKGDHVCHPFGRCWQHHKTLKGILKTLYEQNKSNYYEVLLKLWIANAILSCYHIDTTFSTHHKQG